MTWQKVAAEEITRAFWEQRRSEMVRWLVAERNFNPIGATKAAHNFIETMIFVARETGEPQFQQANARSAR